jgi:preprotein translocase subunit SecE
VAKKRAASKKKSNPVTRYLRETNAELRKVSWPTRKEATQLTIIVLIVVSVMSTFLGSLDLVFSRMIGALLGLI